MFKSYSLAALACVGALHVATAPVHAQGEVANPADPYNHKSVTVQFPAKAGEFTRGRVVEYNEDGSDASVGYSPDDMPGTMTLYLYPVRELTCQQEFKSATTSIKGHKGSKRLKETGVTDIPGFAEAMQMSARYSIPAGAYGFDHPDLVSDLWLGCMPGDKWLVKYRGSFPASNAEQVDAIAERLFSQIDWSALTTAQP